MHDRQKLSKNKSRRNQSGSAQIMTKRKKEQQIQVDDLSTSLVGLLRTFVSGCLSEI